VLIIIRCATQLASLIGFVFACSVDAETIPATLTETVVSTEQAYYGYAGQQAPYTRYPTARAAGDAFIAYSGYQETGFSQVSYNEWQLYFNYWGGNSYEPIYKGFGSCPDNSTWSGSACVRQNYVCPAQGGWTLEGNTCTRTDCAEGTYRDQSTGGACLPEKALGSSCT